MSLGLTLQTPPDDVSRALFRETRRRGYSRAESVAVGSTGFQESGLRMVYSPNGKWGGYFQQDTSYPGRDDPNLNILGFLDRLDEKRRSPGASPDPFKNIFWLQQRPSERSADDAFNDPNARREYYDEIRRHIGRAEQIYDSMQWDAGPAPAPAPAPPRGGPYGLPNGTRINYGAGGFPQWVYDLAKAFNVKASTYPGHQETDRIEFGYARNPQRLNRGIDWSGSVADMQRLADYLFSIRGELEQLIWRNPQNKSRRGVAGGKDVGATAYYDYDGGYNNHEDHVHTRQDHALPVPGKVVIPPPPGVLAPAFTQVDRIGTGSSARTRQPINWLLHTEEGNATAEQLARYCDGSNGVSYHWILRDGILCRVVDTSRASWSVLSANAYTINLCFAGSRSSMTRQEWLARERDIEIAAYVAVRDCRQFGIPLDVIAPPYRRANGISDHKYVTKVLGIGDHTDVGNNFPWDVFARHVAKYANPAASGDDELNDQERKMLDDLHRMVSAFDKDWWTPSLESRSILRHPGETTKYPAREMLRSIDANTHPVSVDLWARVFSTRDLDLLREVADCDTVKYPDRAYDAMLAEAVLAKVLNSAEDAPEATVASNPASSDDLLAAQRRADEREAQYQRAMQEVTVLTQEIEILRRQNALQGAEIEEKRATLGQVSVLPATVSTTSESAGDIAGGVMNSMDAWLRYIMSLDGPERIRLQQSLTALTMPTSGSES